MQTLFIDNAEQGIAPATSHPAFVALAPESFYDQSEHFSPFGNDSGYDALRELEDWYAAGGRDDALPAFVDGLIASWDFGVPADVWTAGRETVHARLRDDSLDEVTLSAVAQGQLAIVLGQLKIRGGLTPTVRTLGTAVVDVLLALADHSRAAYPDWPHADRKSRGDRDGSRRHRQGADPAGLTPKAFCSRCTKLFSASRAE